MPQMDQSELCRLLDQLTPGFLQRDVFHSIARLMVTVTFVIVPLLKREGQVFALLHERDADDLYYPSKLNTPGTVIRASDESLSAVYERLIATELAGVLIKQGPVFVDNVYDLIVRGREISLIHWVELEDGSISGHLCDVSRLPNNIVPTDRPRIEMAATHFRASIGA
jgi:hypothetical protein